MPGYWRGKELATSRRGTRGCRGIGVGRSWPRRGGDARMPGYWRGKELATSQPEWLQRREDGA